MSKWFRGLCTNHDVISFRMENFIGGYPGCEFQVREALEEVLGKEKSEFFFDKVRTSVHSNTISHLITSR